MNNTGIGLTGFVVILFIIFLVLRLTDVIDWAWWIIFSPIWGYIILYIIIVVLIVRLIKKYYKF